MRLEQAGAVNDGCELETHIECLAERLARAPALPAIPAVLMLLDLVIRHLETQHGGALGRLEWAFADPARTLAAEAASVAGRSAAHVASLGPQHRRIVHELGVLGQASQWIGGFNAQHGVAAT